MKPSTVLRLVVLLSALGGSALACGGKTTDGTTATPEQVASLRDRWNAAANTVRASTGSSFDFTWTESAFPHPTYRGGSAEAYEEFAEILVLFYSTGDNLDFAKSHGLLAQPFGDGLSPSRGGSSFSLQEMTSELTRPEPPSYSAFLRADTIAKLKAFCPSVGCAEA